MKKNNVKQMIKFEKMKNKELLKLVGEKTKEKLKEITSDNLLKIDIKEQLFPFDELKFDRVEIHLTSLEEVVTFLTLLFPLFKRLILKTKGRGRCVYTYPLTECKNVFHNSIFVKKVAKNKISIDGYGSEANNLINIYLDEEFQKLLKKEELSCRLYRTDIRYFGRTILDNPSRAYGVMFWKIGDLWEKRVKPQNAAALGMSSSKGLTLYIDKYSKKQYLSIYTKKKEVREKDVFPLAVELVCCGESSMQIFQKCINDRNREAFIKEGFERFFAMTSLLPVMEPLLDYHKFMARVYKPDLEKIPLFQAAILAEEDIQLEQHKTNDQIVTPTIKRASLLPYVLGIAGICYKKKKQSVYQEDIRLVKKDLIEIFGLSNHERSYQKIHESILELNRYTYVEKQKNRNKYYPLFLKIDFFWGDRKPSISLTPNPPAFEKMFQEEIELPPSLFKNVEMAYVKKFGKVRKRCPEYLMKVMVLILLSQKEKVSYQLPRNAKTFDVHFQWLLNDFLPTQQVEMTPPRLIESKNKRSHYSFQGGSLTIRS